MAHQIRDFVLRLTLNSNVYPLLAVGLALGAVIMSMPGGGGGGGG